MTKSEEALLGQTRIATYERCSTDEQDLLRQQKEIVKFLHAKQNTLDDGVTPKYVVWNGTGYQDQGKTGRTFQRADMDRMWADAKMGKFEFVMTWGLSRLGRNLRETVNFVGKLQDIGIDYYDCQMDLWYSKPRDRMLIHQMATFHDHQWVEMVRNTQEKMDQINKDLKAVGCRLGNAGIMDDWVESPRTVRADKQGLAVKYSEEKEASFRELWAEGVPIKALTYHFRNPINPKCKYCGGKPPADGQFEKLMAMKCVCNQPCTQKTIHTTRKKLGLEKRNHHSFVTKDRVKKDETKIINYNKAVPA